MNIKNRIILMSSFILVFSLGVFLYVIAKEIQIEGKFLLDGSNLTIAPLNIPRYGTANPTTTVVGDLWYRSNNLYYNDQGTVRMVAHTGSWSLISEAAILAGTETSSRFISAARLKYAFNNVATPTVSAQAAPKSYVDTAVAGTTKGTVTSIKAGSGLSGGTITTSGTIAVDSTVVRTTGNQTLAGIKTFSGTVIVPPPSASNHAATKKYVDDAAAVSVTLRDVASGTTGNAVCTANSSVCLDVVVAAAPYPSLSYSCLWTNTGSTLKARCLK